MNDHTPSHCPADEGRTLLVRLRDHLRDTIAQELSSLHPVLIDSLEAGRAPRYGHYGKAAWAGGMFKDATMPDGSVNWATVRARLTARLVRLMSHCEVPDMGEQLRAEVMSAGCVTRTSVTPLQIDAGAITGYDLARFICLDLYEFAAESWVMVDGKEAA